jgi:peroxiredoxin/uncharacterized membrane protein YphA (DoxX/SURF4 family)
MPIVLLICRLLLALVFGVAGVAKLVDPAGSRKSLEEFGVPARWTRPLAWLLPLVELACAVALLPAASAWWAACGAAALLVLFTTAMAVSLARGRRPECRCFGQLHSSTVGWTTLARNAGLTGVAALVVWQAPTSAGVGFAALLAGVANLGRLETLVLLLALAVAVLAAFAATALFFLLRQNGRLLLRLDALEDQVGPAAEKPERGLPVDSRAPGFSLKNLGGRTVTLDALLAFRRPLLLFFSEPDCGACEAAFPELVKWQHEHGDRLVVVPIARGEKPAYLAKARKYRVDNLLIGNAEVAGAYRIEATPSAVLVIDGLIASPIAAGIDAIRDLVSTAIMPPPLRKGDPVPSLQLPELNGGTFDLGTLRDRPTVLLFWDPACGFCQQMLEDVKAWERRRRDDEPDLMIVSSGSRQANRKQGFRSRLLLDSAFHVGQILGVGGTPSAVVVDEQGRIASDVEVGAPAVLALAGASHGNAVPA